MIQNHHCAETHVTNRVNQLISQMTLMEKLQMVCGFWGDGCRANQAGFVQGVERLNIPNIYIADGESGVNVSWDATSLPAKVGLAATFDSQVSEEYGGVLGREARACGIHMLLTPRVNIVRDPLADISCSNGGNFQTYGEDPVLNGILGAAEARGLERDNNVIANLKQMFGSSTGAAQGAGNCIIDKQTIHEIYMRPFEYVIRSGVGSAMTNYNQVNGTWTYKYTAMNRRMLRDEWGFNGFIINDWYCLYEPEAIMENVDLAMPGCYYMGDEFYDSPYGTDLLNAVKDPSSPVTEQHIDRAVYHILYTLARFDMLDKPRIPGPPASSVTTLSIKAAKQIALKSAVLLKNDEAILPLDIKRDRVALIGPTARQLAKPVFRESAYGFHDRMIGPLAALQSRTENDILYAVGCDLDGVVIPSANLRASDFDDVCGLQRTTIYMKKYYTPESNRQTPHPSADMPPVTDEQISFSGDAMLPPLPDDKFGYVPYYMWTGKIIASETGTFRLSLQTSMPAFEAYEANVRTNDDHAIYTSGDIYFMDENDADYHRIPGFRFIMNGGSAPCSSVVPCADGYNNLGCYVHMEAGKAYRVFITACSIYRAPVGVRFCWVTPSMMRNAITQAAQTAKCAQKAIVFVWHPSPSSTLSLGGMQDELVYAVAQANPHTIVVLNNGDPVAMPWKDKVKAILEMWYPGQEGGHATADILTGMYNPGGKLPITFPKKIEDLAAHDPSHPERRAPAGRTPGKNAVQENTASFTEGIYTGYRWFEKNDIEPLFEFGFGLSYTEFNYSGLSVSRTADGGLKAQFKVKNTGKTAGEAVPQCYLSRPANVPDGVEVAPVALCAFTRIELEAGEERTVTLEADKNCLCYYKTINEENTVENGEGWALLAGPREVWIGASSKDIRLKCLIDID